MKKDSKGKKKEKKCSPTDPHTLQFPEKEKVLFATIFFLASMEENLLKFISRTKSKSYNKFSRSFFLYQTHAHTAI